MIFELGANNTLIETYWDKNLNKHVRRHQHQPYFYILTKEAHKAEGLDGVVEIKHGFTSLYGDKCSKVFVEHPSVVPRLRDSFSTVFEADIPYLRRCVIDLIDEIQNQYFTVLYFDLETEVKTALLDPDNRILSVSCRDTKTNQRKVFLWTDQEIKQELPEYTQVYESEKEMLNAFSAWVKEVDPTFITAWNLFGFDLVALNNRLGNDKLSPIGQGDETGIKGRLTVDLMDIYRKVEIRTNSVALKVVAEAELETERKMEIDDLPQELWAKGDFKTLVEYNMQDTDVMYLIDQKRGLIRYLVDIQGVAKIPFDDTRSPSPIIDSLCLRKSDKCLPVKSYKEKKKIKGGHVTEPKIGMHENVSIFDFKGEYPSIIRTWNLSPECIDTEGNIEVGNGLRITDKFEGILPMVLEDLMKLRVEYSKTDKMKYNAIKSIINAVYGVTGSPNFRLYHSDIANAITYLGRWLNGLSRDYFEALGYEVIYGDTDSIFIKGVPIDKLEETSIGVNKDINTHIAKLSNRASRVEIEYETTFAKIILIGKKRYCGRRDDGSLKVRGLEIVRTNAANISKEVQSKTIEMLFEEQDPIPYFEELKGQFKQLPLEDLAIPQTIHAMDRDNPHVRAMKLAQNNGIIFEALEPVRILFTRNHVIQEVPLHSRFDISEFEIDYEEMWYKTVVAKVEDLLATINKKVPPLRKTLAEFVDDAFEDPSEWYSDFKGTPKSVTSVSRFKPKKEKDPLKPKVKKQKKPSKGPRQGRSLGDFT